MSAGPVTQSEGVIDALAAARNGAVFHCVESLNSLPRVREAGALDDSSASLDARFTSLDGLPAIEGELQGALTLICQRCLSPAHISLDESVAVVLVQSEEHLARDFGSYEPVLADVHRFDLRWFVEEQVLLAMPLIARHEDESECDIDVDAAHAGPEDAPGETDGPPSQKPFANLRDLLKK